MKIYSSAPMRIDLAGGTLDIYPLYVFEQGGLTLNAAITKTSEVWIETHNNPEIRIISEDLDEDLGASSLDALDPERGLDLLVRIVKFYKPKTGLTITTRNNIPKGSGLGASSSLLIALSHALNHLNGNPLTPEQIINYGANIEAQSIRVPTGKQDYYSATYGGLSTIWFDIEGSRREPLITAEPIINELESRLVISFAGAPRFSALSNWSMFRAYVDGDERTIRNIGRIKKTAHAMRKALMKGNLDIFAQLLGEEWDNRKGLAPGVTNDTIDNLMDKAETAGAISSKICGAGGGGCMLTYCREGATTQVRKALTAAGATVLDATISRHGVQVTTQ